MVRIGPKGRFGVLPPRRCGEVGASLNLAGRWSGLTRRFRCPALFARLSQRRDGLAQGSAGAVIGKASGHLSSPAGRNGFAAFAAVCHGAEFGRAAP